MWSFQEVSVLAAASVSTCTQVAEQKSLGLVFWAQCLVTEWGARWKGRGARAQRQWCVLRTRGGGRPANSS